MDKVPALDKDLLEIEPQTSLKDDVLRCWSSMGRFLKKYGGWFTFIIPIGLTIYLYYIDSPYLQYDSWTQTFVSKERLGNELSKSFEVTLDGKKYDKLYLSTIVIENTGWKAIDGKDVSPLDADPIRVVIPQGIKPFLPFKNELTSKSVHLETILREQEILIKFNYLNPSDRIAISFLHEDAPDNFLKNDMKVTGSAKNLGPIKEKPSYTSQLYTKMGILTVIYLMICFVFMVFRIKKRKKRKEKENKRTECIKRQHEEIVALTQQVENKDETIKQKETFSNTLIGALLVIKQSLQNKEPIDKIFHIIDVLTQDVLKNDKH